VLLDFVGLTFHIGSLAPQYSEFGDLFCPSVVTLTNQTFSINIYIKDSFGSTVKGMPPFPCSTTPCYRTTPTRLGLGLGLGLGGY
jgi:hypothetical protein